MTVLMWVKFLHVLIAITLLGLSFASCFYAYQGMKAEQAFRQFSYKIIVRLEWIILWPMLLITFITGPLLVMYYNFSPTTPWIISAYIYLGLAFLCRIGGICCFSLVCRDKKYLAWPYFLMQGLFWVLMVLIIHDAIAKPMHYLWQF